MSLAIGRSGLNIKLASMLTEYTIDVFREIEDDEAEEDIYLDEFADEVDQWIKGYRTRHGKGGNKRSERNAC